MTEQKAAYDRDKSLCEKANKEYQRECQRLFEIEAGADKAHMQAQAKAAKILTDHKEVIDAYRALFTIPYKRGDPCPGCGKTFVLDKLKCRSKCVFHNSTGYSGYEQDMKLHNGLYKDCPYH